jgi:hypothetical protein
MYPVFNSIIIVTDTVFKKTNNVKRNAIYLIPHLQAGKMKGQERRLQQFLR